MRVTHLFLKLFFLTALILGLSGCQKDPVQPMDASAQHQGKVTEKKVTEKKALEKKPATTPSANKNASKSASVATKTPEKTTPTIQNEKKPVNQTKAETTKPSTTKKSSVTTKPKTPSTSTSTQKTTKPAPATPAETVTVTIIGYGNQTLLPATKVPYTKGETFLDATLSTRKFHIIVSFKGSGASAYVDGINNEFEFDHGAKSGWLATKNGVKLTQSAGITSLKPGDRIEWRYTTTGE
ncbi:MAG TPA: DUF4430 domain-containing protein [Sporolactobacillaceae bacterium]|nr:DUF4430 domain-containing protein [Sporolactobacillaceae bacterium]